MSRVVNVISNLNGVACKYTPRLSMIAVSSSNVPHDRYMLPDNTNFSNSDPSPDESRITSNNRSINDSIQRFHSRFASFAISTCSFRKRYEFRCSRNLFTEYVLDAVGISQERMSLRKGRRSSCLVKHSSYTKEKEA